MAVRRSGNIEAIEEFRTCLKGGPEEGRLSAYSPVRGVIVGPLPHSGRVGRA